MKGGGSNISTQSIRFFFLKKKNGPVGEKEEVSARRRNNGSDVVDIFSYLELDFPIEEAVPENFGC